VDVVARTAQLKVGDPQVGERTAQLKVGDPQVGERTT